MPFKKIEDTSENKACRNPEHDPPKHISLKPGTYEWTCPVCGKSTRVKIAPATL
jgi:rubrerythrin